MAEGSTWQRVVFNGNCLTKAKVTEAKRALYLEAVLDGICHREANGQWQMSPNGICLSWQMVDGIWDKEAKGRRQIGNGIRDSGIWNPSAVTHCHVMINLTRFLSVSQSETSFYIVILTRFVWTNQR